LTMGLAFVAFCNWICVGEFGELFRWSQTVLDIDGGDSTKGAGFGVGSPLAVALAYRGVARWWLGQLGWREDLHDAVAMARRNNHPATFAAVVAWTYGLALHYGALGADESTVRTGEEAVHMAGSSNWTALGLAEYTLAIALLNRDAAPDRDRGLQLMVQFREVARERARFLVPVAELWIARERARCGDGDAAISVIRQAVDELRQAGQVFYDGWGTGVLVESLLERGARGDLAEAHEAIDRLANLPDDGSAVRKITLLRLRALLARARGDEDAYRDHRDRYRAMAKALGFEGHMKWAEAMP